MTDLEPVQPSAILPRDAGRVVPRGPWAAVSLSRTRTIVASRIRALGAGPLLPVSALAVAAIAAARAVERAARVARPSAGTVGPEVIGRIPGEPASGAMLQVAWTHVEMRWRW
jgi:hypothetical protein